MRQVVNQHVSDEILRDNILYHLHLDKDVVPTLEHSKRLRSYLCFLFAEESGYSINDVLPLSISVELLHNSTLIVDDIQDNDSIRCGRTALWKKTDLASALNASYYLGLMSLQFFHLYRKERNYYDYSVLFVNILNKLISGQQKDISADVIADKGIETYYEIAKGKTGALINLCCHFGSMPFAFDEEVSSLLQEFSDLFSCAYQIQDDLKDLKVKQQLDKSNIINFLGSKDDDFDIVFEKVNAIRFTLLQKLRCNVAKLKDCNVIRSNKLSVVIEEILAK